MVITKDHVLIGVSERTTMEAVHQVSNLHDSSELISLHFYVGPLENSYLYSVTDPACVPYPRTYTRVFTLAEGI